MNAEDNTRHHTTRNRVDLTRPHYSDTIEPNEAYSFPSNSMRLKSVIAATIGSNSVIFGRKLEFSCGHAVSEIPVDVDGRTKFFPLAAMLTFLRTCHDFAYPRVHSAKSFRQDVCDIGRDLQRNIGALLRQL